MRQGVGVDIGCSREGLWLDSKDQIIIGNIVFLIEIKYVRKKLVMLDLDVTSNTKSLGYS